MLSNKFYIVTGAPGAGKSSTIQVLLTMQPDPLVFDIDWLADAAGDLAQRDIYTDPTTWKPYRKLWLEMLHSISRNHRSSLWFAPMTKADLEGLIDVANIHWLLLDCNDQERTRRLEQRQWSQGMIQEARQDALELRQEFSQHIDTGMHAPEEVARQVLEWHQHINRRLSSCV